MKKWMLAVAGVMLTVALAGCSTPAPTAETSSPTMPPTSASTPSLAPSPTPTEEPVDQRVEWAKAERQRFLDMSLDEFTALPDDQKLVFIALTNIAFFDEYETSWRRWAGTGGQLVPEVSRDSDGQTISDMTIWQMRLAMMFTGDEREKYLRAIAPGMGDSHLYLTLEEWSVANPIRWVGHAAAQNNLLPLETVTQAFDAVDFQGSYSRRMMLGDFLAVFFYDDVTLPDGSVVSIWRRQ